MRVGHLFIPCLVAVFAMAATPSLAQSAGGGAAPPPGVWAGTPGATGFKDPSGMGMNGQPGTISPAAAEPLRAVYREIQSKNWQAAIVKAQSARTVVGFTPYDTFMLDYYFGVAYYNAGDVENAANAYYAAATSPAAGGDPRNDAIRSAIHLENEAKHFDKAVTLVALAQDAGIADEKMLDIGAVAADNLGDDTRALAFAQAAVAAAAKTGAPAKITANVLLMIQVHRNDKAGEFAALKLVCAAGGDKDDWGSLADLAFGQLNAKSKSMETAALFLYRLRLATGATTNADDYVLAGQLALAHALPGDAARAIHAGLDAGQLADNKTAAAILATADKQTAADAANLPKAEAIAVASKTGDAAVAVGENYFGLGRYADAIAMANAAIAKGGKRTLEAQLLLGAAKAMTGDTVGAAQALGAVKGDPDLELAASLWLIYAARPTHTASAG